jgi:hypothetical protein
MLSSSSINLRRRGKSLDLQIPHSQSREKVVPIHQKRDIEEMATVDVWTTSGRHSLKIIINK